MASLPKVFDECFLKINNLKQLCKLSGPRLDHLWATDAMGENWYALLLQTPSGENGKIYAQYIS